MQETWVWFLSQEDPLEMEMATYSSILAGESHGQRNPGSYSSRTLKSRTRLTDQTTTRWSAGLVKRVSTRSAVSPLPSVLTALWQWASLGPQHLETASNPGQRFCSASGSTSRSISAPKAEVATSWLPWLLTNAFKQVSLALKWFIWLLNDSSW